MAVRSDHRSGNKDLGSLQDSRTVVDLHKQFHAAAGQVAAFATTGKRAEAEAQMSSNGNYTQISMKLTQAMMSWSNSLT